MSMSKLGFLCLLAFTSFCLVPGLCLAEPTPRLGELMSQEEIAFWDRSITPNSTNLPPGSGSVKEGEEVYIAKCAACHGEDGRGQAPLVALVGGQGSLTESKPIKTVGSYWPYATTLFDYIRRAMPFGQQKSLTDDEIYAVTAYTLFLNGVIDAHSRLTPANLNMVVMPNGGGFYWDQGASRPTQKH
jgi:hypothetical protein